MENELQEQETKQASSHLSLKKMLHKKTLLLGVGLLLMMSMGTYILVSPSHKQIVPTPTIQIATSIPTELPPTVTPTPTIAQPTAVPTPTTIPTPTIPSGTAWKTYTNSQYDYTIKYPPDWIVKDLGILEPKIPSYITFNGTTASSSARFITISATTRTYEEQLALGASSSAITIAGVKGTKQAFQDSDGNTSTVIILPRKNDLLVLRAKTSYLTIFNFMLSTLKLTL